MITCPVALALMFLSPLLADVVESDSKTDLNVLQATVAASRSEKAISAFGLKAPSANLPLAVDKSGRRYDHIEPAVFIEETSSGDVLPSPQRVVLVPALKPVAPK